MLFCEACARHTPRARDVRPREPAALGGRGRPYGGLRDAKKLRLLGGLAPRQPLSCIAAEDLVTAMAFSDDLFSLSWLLGPSEGRVLMVVHGQVSLRDFSMCTLVLYGARSGAHCVQTDVCVYNITPHKGWSKPQESEKGKDNYSSIICRRE